MFFQKLAKIYNSGQSRSIILCGNVNDIFYNGTEFVPLIPFLCDKTKSTDKTKKGLIHIVYELNGPIRIAEEHKAKLRAAWITGRTGEDPNALMFRQLPQIAKGQKGDVQKYTDQFENCLNDAIENPTLALEFLRQLTMCSRKALTTDDLLIIVEAADMLLPPGTGDLASLNDKQLHRIRIVSDWLGDPAFINGNDTVIFIAESRSLIHPRISKLPQVVSVEVPSPDAADRRLFLQAIKEWKDLDSIVKSTACLSVYALRQLTKAVVDGELNREDIIEKVEDYIQSQLGEDVVEFKKPTHRLNDCVGFTVLKKFLKENFIPRMQLDGAGLLPGAAVAGPIGGGKTFIFEAVASELDMPVLVLKNIRSQWFGQTDVIFERLRRVLEALDRVLIFVDEADTQFGGVGEGTHETERRLTGKIQAMMSDPKLKGKVYWLLMTARIHLLSPDIRRPGRVGDLIIPVLDPVGEDRKEFLHWALKDISLTDGNIPAALAYDSLLVKVLAVIPKDYSSASFASLKNNLAFKKTFLTVEELITEIQDFIQPAIAEARRYQTLQALVNCTRRSLLPDPNIEDQDREKWADEIRELEAKGIS